MQRKLHDLIMAAPGSQLIRLQAACTAAQNGDLLLCSRLLHDTANRSNGPFSAECRTLANKLDTLRKDQQKRAFLEILTIFGQRLNATSQIIEQALIKAAEQLESGKTAAACIDLACKHITQQTPGAAGILKRTLVTTA